MKLAVEDSNQKLSTVEPAAAHVFLSSAKSLIDDILNNPPTVEEEVPAWKSSYQFNNNDFNNNNNNNIKTKSYPAFESGDRTAAAEYLLAAALATLAGKSTLPKRSLLAGKLGVSTVYIKNPEGIHTTGWVEQRLTRIVPKIFDIR